MVCDYIAGMTDSFAVRKFEEIYVPKFWDEKIYEIVMIEKRDTDRRGAYVLSG